MSDKFHFPHVFQTGAAKSWFLAKEFVWQSAAYHIKQNKWCCISITALSMPEQNRGKLGKIK